MLTLLLKIVWMKALTHHVAFIFGSIYFNVFYFLVSHITYYICIITWYILYIQSETERLWRGPCVCLCVFCLICVTLSITEMRVCLPPICGGCGGVFVCVWIYNHLAVLVLFGCGSCEGVE